MNKLSFLLSALFAACVCAGVDFSQVADLKPYAMRVYGVRSAKAESETSVRVTFGASITDLRRKAEAFRVMSPDDSEYAYEKFAKPIDAKGSKDRQEFAKPAAASFPNKAQVAFNTSETLLTLPKPMKKGCHYAVLAQGVGDGMVTAGTCAAKFTYGAKDEQWDSPDANGFAAAMMGLRAVTSVGDGKILCSFGPVYSEASGRDFRNWQVTVNGERVKVVGIGRRSNNECFVPTGWGGTFGAILYNDVYLDLGRELKEGDAVEVVADKRITTANNAAKFTYSKTIALTRSIKTNQIGYLPNDLKVAYLGQWLGSFPEREVIASDAKETGPVAFTLEQYYAEAGNGTQEERALKKEAELEQQVGRTVSVRRGGSGRSALPGEGGDASGRSALPGEADEELEYDYEALAPYALRLKALPKFALCEAKTGKTVFEGPIVLAHNGLYDDYGGNMSAENVYTLDFTAYTKPGTYFLYVSGVGRSLAFDIASDVFERAFRVQAQGIYEQRCGCELDPKLTGGWKRIACHAKGIVTTKNPRSATGGWGQFGKNIDIETDPNPAFAPVKAAREKIENDPSVTPLAFRTIGTTKEVSSGRAANVDAHSGRADRPDPPRLLETSSPTGQGKVYMTGEGKENGIEAKVMPKADQGCTISFFAKRIDSFGGNAWFGSFFQLGGKDCLNYRLGWGDLPGVGRINNGKWWHFALRVAPADEKGFSQAQLIANGKPSDKAKWKLQLAKGDGTLRFGQIDGQAAEGTYYADIRFYDRALTDKELADLTATVPETLPHVIQATGGHHDAGDYNPRTHIDVAQQLMYAYELRPEAFRDSQLGIPERGNGIPDILDEALWAVKIWEGLQCEDGGVRNGTESQGDPNFIQTVELDDKGDYAWAKDTKGSYLAAGTFAQASRLLAKCGQQQRAEELKNRAERAYAWAIKNPTPDLKSLGMFGEYNFALRAYAAAELYHTTAKQEYHKDFFAFTPWQKKPNAEIGVHGFFDASLAAYSYALIPEKMADKKVHDAVIAAIRKDADMMIRGSDKMSYKFLRHPYAPISWGTGAYENYAVQAAFVWALTGEKKYRDWLIRTCDNTLGANPMGLSYITGIGQRTIRCPLHNSRYRADGVPVDGLQGQGPNQRGDGYAYTAVSYPWFKKGFAILQNLSDVHFEIGMDEPTANNMANTMMIFGLLSGK